MNLYESIKSGSLKESYETSNPVEFDAIEFEKNIPHNMRFKTFDIVNDGKDLYWVTQAPFTKEELKQFQRAFKNVTNFENAYVTLRDLSSYDYFHDKGAKVLAVVTKDGYDAGDYVNAILKEWPDWDFEGEPYKSMYESKENNLTEFEMPKVNELVDALNKYTTAKPIEDEENLVVELLQGILTIDPDGIITFHAPWLPQSSNPITFKSVTDVLTTLEILNEIFNGKSIKDSEELDSDNETILKDFQLYLNDHNIAEPTEEDINDYFTGLFYDIETPEDVDYSNKAEELIRSKYLNETEEVSFEEIIRDMENAEDYDDLYNAADKIVDIELRSKVKDQIKTCEEDKDPVDVAYSVTTSDLLDMKIHDLNEASNNRN